MTSTHHRPALNGVDVPKLFATLDTVKAQPAAAQFQFRARNEWISGTHNRTTIQGFYGAGMEDGTRTAPFTYDADHPEVLVGTNNGPTAVEFLLHAIAACLTSGIGNIAAARGITLYRVRSTVEGDASPERLAALVEQSRKRSAVYDVLTNGTDVVVEVMTPSAA